MAYAAVISLQNTIHHFLNSSSFSLVRTSRVILELMHGEATSLQEVLKRQDERGGNKKLDALDGRTREALHRIEDVLEFHVSNQYFSSSCDGVGASSSRVLISVDEEEVQELLSLSKLVKKMEEDYIQELEKVDEEEEEEDDDDDGDVWTSSSINFGVEMVGLSDEYAEIKEGLLKRTRPDDFVVYPMLGSVGSGITVIAKEVFDDLRPLFECACWVTVGRNCPIKQILGQILAQVFHILRTSTWQVDKLVKCLYRRLEGRRYMIVLDGICHGNHLDVLLGCFPAQDNGSIVMYTSSIKAIFDARPNGFHHYVIDRQNDYNMRDILRIPMGCLGSCTPELEESLLKIARNFQGCFLAVVTAFPSLAYKAWADLEDLAADHNNPMFLVHDELLQVSKFKEEMQQLYGSVMDEEKKKIIANFRELIDLSENSEEVKMTLFPKRFILRLEIFSFYGMAGIGKSALVKKIYADTSIFHDIDHRAWINLGPKYHSEEIVVDILAQIYPDIDKRHMMEDVGLVEVLCAKLSLKKCLIVLDDVWRQEPVHYLKKLFPAIKGKLLLTTRLEKVAQFEQSDKVHEVRLLNLEESWSLFCHKVFVSGVCPPELKIVGKKICENCEGLPLLILTVGDLLSKAERTPEFWNKVADKKNSLFVDAQKKLSKILLPSYKTLPQHLKPIFLYMGVFPPSYQIPISKLNHLLKAERFLERSSCQHIEDFVAECLSELAKRSLVMVCQMGSNFRVKTYRLHSVFWYLSTSEASKSMFFQVLNTYIDHSIEDIKCHRRLCIHKNVLLGIKDVCNSVASISSAHSLMCNGPPHKYQVPICFGLRLLRIMDALTIRLYEFPIELVKLIHLRYLALTCNGKLPASISGFWSLQYLIVGRHLSINSSEDSICLPIEIWNMKELRHLQIMGGCLPNPNCGASLPNLLALLDVSAQSCTKRVLKRIPNVKKLGIQIELSPCSDGNPFHCLNRIWRLHKLESLKCVVVNPELRSRVATPPAPHSMFPSGLKKLSLSGFGYPWEYMSIIGKLQNLEVLKLRCFAFQGPKWESTNSRHLQNLKYFTIDDSDLEHFELKYGTLGSLVHFSFKHCYKLKSLPDSIPITIEKLEIVDCNPLVVTWAKQMKELFYGDSIYTKVLKVQSSWEDHRLKH